MADIPNRKFYRLVSEPNAPTPSFPSDTEEPQNPVNPPGSGGVAIRHNSTLEKDGGDTINDFFGHLTEEELERVQNLPNNFSGNHSDLNLDDGTNPHGTTADDVGLGAFEGYTPETLPISDDVQEVLDTLSDQEYPFTMNWIYDGSTKEIPIPEEYYLSRVENIRFIDIQLPRDNISYVPHPLDNKITLGELWTPSINTVLYLDLLVLKDI